MLVRVTPPAPIVTTADAKKHLRVEHPDDDAYIDALVATATAWIDGADGWLGRALGVQTWDLKLDSVATYRRSDWWHWCSSYGWRVRLPLPPLVEVVSVTYKDAAGATQTLAPSGYAVHGVDASQGGFLALANGASWPAIQYGPEAVTVRFRAGYPNAGDPPVTTVPAPIRHAILLMIGHLYHHREEVTAGQGGKPERLPMGVDALLSPYRVFS